MTTNVPKIVEGEIIFRQIPTSFSGATVFIFLEDNNRADAPSVVVARSVLHGISRSPENISSIHFRIVHPSPDSNAQLAISIHIDVDGDGKISPGDFITMESFPVTGNNPLAVYVQRVG